MKASGDAEPRIKKSPGDLDLGNYCPNNILCTLSLGTPKRLLVLHIFHSCNTKQ